MIELFSNSNPDFRYVHSELKFCDIGMKIIFSRGHGNYKEAIEDECGPNLGEFFLCKQNLGRRKFAHKLM